MSFYVPDIVPRPFDPSIMYGIICSWYSIPPHLMGPKGQDTMSRTYNNMHCAKIEETGYYIMNIE